MSWMKNNAAEQLKIRAGYVEINIQVVERSIIIAQKYCGEIGPKKLLSSSIFQLY